MASGNYEYQSDFAKKHHANGFAEGEAKGEAKAILTILDARGIAVSSEQKRRIQACTELDMLERWTRRSVSIATADELFAD